MLLQLHAKRSAQDQNTKKERRARRGLALEDGGAHGFLVNATTGVGAITPCLNRMVARAKEPQAPKFGALKMAIGVGLGLKAERAPDVDATDTTTSPAGPSDRDCTRQVHMWYSTYPSSVATTSDDECKRCTDVITSHELALSD